MASNHLTVAVVVKRDNKYLCVAEYADQQRVYNQPAGHVEPGEKLAAAAIRETLEETGWTVELTRLISLSTYLAPSNGMTYYRVCLAAEAISFNSDYQLDSDIDEALWLSYEDILERREQLRSPLVLQAIEDYQNGRIHPLDMLYELFVLIRVAAITIAAMLATL